LDSLNTRRPNKVEKYILVSFEVIMDGKDGRMLP
jgi:hypothetical protein